MNEVDLDRLLEEWDGLALSGGTPEDDREG
jgi:hypothetical protein